MLGFDYNPCGHPAFGIFTVPHYDAHVYYITDEERLALTCPESPPSPVCPDTPGNANFFELPGLNVPNNYTVELTSAVPQQVSRVT